METYELEAYVEAIKAATGHACELTRVSTAALVERLADPSAAGKYDLVFGTALSALLDPRARASLASAGLRLDGLPPSARDDEGGAWFAPSAYAIGLCLGQGRLAELGLRAPATWADLAHQVYRGELVAPNPRSSGAAYLQLASLLQVFGEADGWDLALALHRNIREYTASGLGPCGLVVDGRAAVGVSVSIAVAHLAREGALVSLGLPEDGAACEPEAFGLLRDARDPGAAREVLAWTLTTEAQGLFASFAKAPLVGCGETIVLPGQHTVLRPLDVACAARDRGEILARWGEMTGL